MFATSLAVGGAAAAATYADAKYSISNDFWIVYPLFSARLISRYLQRKGRLNLFYFVEDRALSPKAAERTHPLLWYQGREWTYEQAYQTILKYATWLQDRHGVKQGQIVCIDFTNKPEFLWLWFGLWALGATPSFINYNLVGDRLVHSVRASGSNLVIIDAEVASALDDEATREAILDGGKRHIAVFDDATSAVVETWRATRPPDSCRSWAKLPDVGILIFTSGTTGMPKPAIVSWHKLQSGAHFAKRWMGLKKSDRFYTSMPLYHSSATILGVGQVFSAGATLVLGHKFSATKTIPEVQESRATIFQYVGETCRYLLASPPSSSDRDHNLRIAFGNGLRPDVWEKFKKRFGIPIIAEFYGSTEGPSASWNYQSGEYGMGAIGRNGAITQLVLGLTTTIIKLDPDTDMPLRDATTGFCIRAAPNEPGEVVWRLNPDDIKASFQGYFNNPTATDERIARDVFKKGDAWFRTGDVQRRDSDGLWYFIDRIGDTFRWKSENVSTAEVADVIGQNPAVAEVAVYGVQLPRHDGRCGCAAIVMHSGRELEPFMASLESTTMDLPRYARPLFVRIVDQLERTGNNKIVKAKYQQEGVDLDKCELGSLWWCPKVGEGYIPFDKTQWKLIEAGSVKL